MPRVLHINDYPLSFGGGAEVILGRTIRLLEQAGWDARTFTSADLPDSRVTARRYLSNPIACRALATTLAEFRPHVVHVHNCYHVLSPGILSTLADFRERQWMRVVMTGARLPPSLPQCRRHVFPRRRPRTPIDPSRARNWSYLLSRRWDHRGLVHSWLRLAQHVWNYRWGGLQGVPDVVVSPSRFLEALLNPLVRETRCIPHPAPRWDPMPTVARPETLTWLFVGRLEPEKGLADFLQLLPEQWSGRMTVVGDGTDRTNCEAIAARRGWRDRIEFRGKLPHAVAALAIAGAHVLVLPSLVPESYGLVLAEALSLGTSVLATALGGSRELVESAEVGYLFEPGNRQELAAQIERIETDFRNGSLNRFDASAFFAGRGEERYLQHILDAYAGRPQS